MSFSDLVVNLKANINDFAKNMKQASNIANSTANTINQGLGRAAKQSKFEFKDVARIVQGIMISKAFYGGMNAIRNCTSAVMEFSTQLEYAKMTYENMFGNSELADEFINVLKDFAARTPFDFTESEAAAKRLLAYGIEYKNVMYVMQGIMSASSAQNNPAIIESVSRAMGQIYTKGRLMNEEMRQLAEAGIPAYEILREKLGLTQKQLQNLGNEAIPASVAINALIDGMNERFSGVVENSTKTLRGAVSNIKDNLLILSSGVFDPLYQKVRSLIIAFGDWIGKIRDIYELQGLGGVFEKIIPPELQMQVRIFVANLMNLWTVLKLYLYDAFQVCKSAAYALLMVFNALAPVITMVLDILGQMIHYITSNTTSMQILTAALAAAATMWVVFKLKALAAMVVASVAKAISKALMALSTVMSFVAAHPLWALLMTVGAVVVGLSGGFNKLGDAIRNVQAKMAALNGVDPTKLFVKESKKRENDLSKFNERLDTTTDTMNAVADASEKAAKKAKKAADKLKKSMKDLLSFDEVFKLTKNNLDADTSTGAIDVPTYNPTDIPDVGDLGDLGDIGDSLIPETPDFGEAALDFVNSFIGSLKEKFLSAGIGAILGGILGSILGGPLGAKIGAIAGTIAGWFWDDICDKLGLGDIGKLTVPICSILGAAIGKAVGHPILGTAIGALVGWLIDGIGQAIETGDTSKIWTPLGALIGTAIGFALGGTTGAFAGGAIGLAIGKFMELFWDEMAKDMGLTDVGKIALPIATVIGGAIGLATGNPLLGAGAGLLVGGLIDKITLGVQTGNWTPASEMIGTALGSAIGMVVGHPFIGAAIGKLVGFVAGKIIEGFQTGNFDWPAIATPIGGGIGAAIGMIVGGPIGAAIGAAIGSLVGWITGKFIEADWSKVTDAFTKPFIDFGNTVKELFHYIWDPIKEAFDRGDWLSLGANIVKGIVLGIVGAVGTVAGAVVTFFQAVWNSLCEIFGIHSPAEAMKPIGVNIILGILEGFTETIGQVISWLVSAGAQIISTISGWFTNAGSTISGWCSSAASAISGWVASTVSSFGSWVSNTKSKITSWASNTSTKISTWTTNTNTKIGTWVTNTRTKITTWASNVQTKISTWASTTSSRISTWASTTSSRINTWASTITSRASSAMSSFTTYVSNGMSTALGRISSFCSSAMSMISSWASSFGSWVSNTISNASRAISRFASSAGSRVRSVLPGHATGGVFNREHVARFAEGNRAEAVIPLQNRSAMQPFVDAVSDGLTQTLAPILAGNNNRPAQNDESETLRPLYVGTLIADERGLKELNRKMKIIQIKEDRRG